MKKIAKNISASGIISLVIGTACATQAGATGVPDTYDASGEMDRRYLPIKEPVYPYTDIVDAHDATPPPRFQVTAPEGAPNVVIVLIDDLGFAGTSAFGGPVGTETFDSIASEGLVYNNFHTTAVSSPTRTAIKSGRNHHVGNMGGIIESATAFPGNTGQIPNDVAPVAEMLRLNGYNTAAFGKWHELAAWEVSVAGPYDRWPTHQGFEKFYGFLGGETNQWAPFIYDGTIPVELPEDPDYHFLPDMTNQAIDWMKFQNALAPDKPFFMYYAPGATHAPHHVPEEWIDRWIGKFDGGWDVMRQEILDRQIASGIVPAGTELAPRPEGIPSWDSLSEDQKTLFAHQFAVFAAFLDYTDHYVGELIDAIEKTGELDNTLLFLVYGDNGTSAEGGTNGMFSEMTYFNGVQEQVGDMLEKLDKWGGPETYPHMAGGWAVAMDTPYTWTKQVASDFGGTKVGMAVRWPEGFSSQNELRNQFHHVIDVAPTILEAAGVPEPVSVNGTKQRPMDGVSMVYTFDEAEADDQHTIQYFEMFGNRAIYEDGWLARTIHKAPWEAHPRRDLEDDIWELFDTREDFSLVNDLSGQYPEKMAAMQALFLEEASRNYALPIDDRTIERMNAATAGRPDLMDGRTSLTLAGGMTGMSENVFINIKNNSKRITAEIEVPEDEDANGIIIAQGGRFGGWALYVLDGVLAYDYNFVGLERYTVAASEKLEPGTNMIVFDFAYDGGGLAKGGDGTLYINGEKVAEGRIDRTQPMVFSADETADVGVDLATPVVESIGAERESRFNGTITSVTVQIGEMDDVARAEHEAAHAEGMELMASARQ